jgi:hypothetical protein
MYDDAQVPTPFIGARFAKETPYEAQAFPWSGLAPCACAWVSDM